MKTKSTQSKFLFALATILCCIISINSFGQCSMPSGLNVTGITVSEATLNWTAVPQAAGYNIQYRVVGTPSWTTMTSTIESLTISSLNSSSNYEWQVQTDCGHSILSGFKVDNFTTLTMACDIPTGLNSTGITTTSATLGWDALTNVAGYNIRYRVVGMQTWSVMASSAASITVSSLTPATTYECQVQSDCGGAYQSYFSKPISFNTLPSASGCNVIPTALSAVSSSATSALLNWTGAADDGTNYSAYSYVIQYRVAGTQIWSITNSSVPSVTLSGLTPSASYEWMVSTDCGNANNRSAFSAISTFSVSDLSQNGNSYITTVPNASNPATQSAMFISSGSVASDAQIVLDWLAAHGIH